MKKGERKKNFERPDFCDLDCAFASWPKEEALDGSGSCRTFQALYCRKLKRIVPKNGSCRA